METQKTFKRYEIKYLVTDEQRSAITEIMSNYMHIDDFGRSTISNIYFDTPTKLLVRRSLEKPLYKEKLRLRCYGVAKDNSKAYVELKKKYDGVVYKRRAEMTYSQAIKYLAGGESPYHSQITDELDYFLGYYGNLRPSTAIYYDRVAYYGNDDRDLRITFDDNILWRNMGLDLRMPAAGEQLLMPGQSLMELKVGGAMPLWLADTLNEMALFKASFSKYGNAYISQCAAKAEKAQKNERSIYCA